MRIFFGLEAIAPWPETFPTGRLIDPTSRHATLVFLGDCNGFDLKKIPLPPFVLGFTGFFDRLLIFQHAIGWHVQMPTSALQKYQETLLQIFQKQPEEHELLLHVTLARKPFDEEGWRRAFQKLPVLFPALHLYESHENLLYKPIWTHSLIPPFEEIEHTADIAYKVRGRDLHEIYNNAKMALAFRFPQMLDFYSQTEPKTLDALISDLNRSVSLADSAIGCPFKAVSFSSKMLQNDAFTEWEMIVDV